VHALPGAWRGQNALPPRKKAHLDTQNPVHRPVPPASASPSALSAIRPVIRQTFFRVLQDFKDGLAVLGGEACKLGGRISSRQDFPQPAIQTLSRNFGKLIECFRVNQVAAGVAQQPGFQIEIAERPALAISRTGTRESLTESRDAADRFGQTSFLREQHVLQKLLDHVIDARGCGFREFTRAVVDG
jgi:hypothetical protein